MSTPNNPYAYPAIFTKDTEEWNNGMELRDYFAGQALAWMVQRDSSLSNGYGYVAAVSYALADAMLKERSKGDGE